MSRPIETAPKGQVFGRLTVIDDAAPLVRKSGKRSAVWNCRCECGTVKQYRAESLKKGATKSCGCISIELAIQIGKKKRTHGGLSGSFASEYMSYIAMKNRCRPSGPYGKKGISVCSEWKNSFEQFVADMGPKPSPEFTIDRIDFFGNYEPSNCRLATRAEQARNRRCVVISKEIATEIRKINTGQGKGRRVIAKELNLPMGAVVGALRGSWSK